MDCLRVNRDLPVCQYMSASRHRQARESCPYYIGPDGKVGQREAIRDGGPRGGFVFRSREHVIALEPRGKGLLGVTLRHAGDRSH
jgi:DNA end-binding protein Ku